MTATHEQQVYVIQHELGPVKIGIAKQPRKRLSDIQIGSPFEYKLRNTETPTNAQEVENYLHTRFREYHLRGEWFDLPPETRDFEIPTHIDDYGEPNVEVELPLARSAKDAWADFFHRAFRAFRSTRSKPRPFSKIHETVMEIGGFDEKEEETKAEPEPSLDTAEQDAPAGKVRCTQCGHYFDHTENGCPMCDSRDFSASSRNNRREY